MKKILNLAHEKFVNIHLAGHGIGINVHGCQPNVDMAFYVLTSAADYYAHDCILKRKLIFHETSLFFCTFAPFNLDPFPSLKMKNQAPATMLNLLR